MKAVVLELRDRVASARAHNAYHQLVLLVGAPRSGKTTVLRALADGQRWPLINLNLELSERLIQEPSRFRQIRVLDHMRDLLGRRGDAPVVVDNIELLFQRDLQQDPLQVLLAAARSRPVVASWPGACTDGALTYAVSGHPEHHRYDNPACAIVPIPSSFATAHAAPQG